MCFIHEKSCISKRTLVGQCVEVVKYIENSKKQNKIILNNRPVRAQGN